MIETSRLILRPFDEADKPAFAALMNTPAMMAKLGGVQAPESVALLVDKRMRDQAQFGFSYWAMILNESGVLVGTCGLRIASNYDSKPVHGMHEIGWRVGEQYWGRGFAFEAARASLDWGWSNTSAAEIAAWTTPSNFPSLAVMRKLRMTRRPLLDFDDDPGIGRQLVHVVGAPHPNEKALSNVDLPFERFPDHAGDDFLATDLQAAVLRVQLGRGK